MTESFDPASFESLPGLLAAARDRIPRDAVDHIDGAAGEEATLLRNAMAFDSVAFRPRVLRDISIIDSEFRLLGREARLPVALAPIGSLHMIRPDGPREALAAAGMFGIPGFVSSVSQTGFEELAGAGPAAKALQLYIRGEPVDVARIVTRARELGYVALAVTVDSAMYGIRDRQRLAKSPVRKAGTGREHQARLTWDMLDGIREAAGPMPPGNKNIVFTNSNQAFTIFSKIFIPNDLKSNSDLNSILIHEKAHLQQWHMIDLIIAESNLLLTWFNPFSWLISRMIKENHEHLADRSVLSRGVNPAHYKAQLLNHATGVELFRLGNQFNYSLTKKRFNMMKKIKSPKKGFIKYLALVPAIVVTLGLFTAASAQLNTFKGKVVFEDGSPATGASIIVAGGTHGTVVDRDGTFSLELNGNPEVAISFVGYQTEKVFANSFLKKDIVLHPKACEIDLKDVKASNPDANRIEIKATSGNNKDQQPLFVVDGKVVKEIKSIDSGDIEKVVVIKDSNSPEAKKYMAENGVIIITTKDNNATSDKIISSQEEIFYVVEDMPSFPGGKEKMKGFIEKNLVYPEKAKKKGLSGEVYTQFIVDTKGNLVDIVVAKSTDEIFNEAALNVIKAMPPWNPGKQRGKPVSVKVTVPIRFTAEKD